MRHVESQHFEAPERDILHGLDELLRRPPARRRVDAIVAELERELEGGDESLVWRSVPLETWGGPPAADIASSWVFLLRGGATTGPERHPNSRQRMMSYRGSGEFPVKRALSDPWTSTRLSSELDTPLEHRWVSIPRNWWHQGVVDAGAHWAVVSFQTARATELIEERPDPAAPGGIVRRLYEAPQPPGRHPGGLEGP